MFRNPMSVALTRFVVGLCPLAIAMGGCVNPSQVPHAASNALGMQASESSADASASAARRAARAFDFIDSIGVNTHFSYTNTPYYEQYASVIPLIQKLGAHHVRDGLQTSWIAPDLYAIYSKLAEAGIHTNLVVPNPSSTLTANSMAELLPNYHGMESIESPNEYDQAGGSQWAATLQSFLPVVWQTGERAGVPVVGPALTQVASYGELGNVSADMTYANLHAYWGGRNPETGGWGGPDAEMNYYGSLPYDFDELDIDSPGRPVFMTESGYVVDNSPSQNVIPEWVEAVYEPRLLLHAWNEGIKRTFIYELMDEPSSTPGIGLLRSDLSERPAFAAVSRMTTLLADSNRTFTPGSLTYSLSSSSGIETSLFQKGNGSFWLVLWNPGSIWDVNAVESTPIAAKEVTLSVSGGKQIKVVWSFNDSGTTTSTDPNAASAKLSIRSTITLVKID